METNSGHLTVGEVDHHSLRDVTCLDCSCQPPLSRPHVGRLHALQTKARRALMVDGAAGFQLILPGTALDPGLQSLARHRLKLDVCGRSGTATIAEPSRVRSCRDHGHPSALEPTGPDRTTEPAGTWVTVTSWRRRATRSPPGTRAYSMSIRLTAAITSAPS